MDDSLYRILRNMSESLQKMVEIQRRRDEKFDRLCTDVRRLDRNVKALGPRVGSIESREAAEEIEEELAGTRDTPPDRSLIGKAILVAEDEPALSRLLFRYLEKLGAETIVVKSAREGRQLTAHVDDLHAAIVDFHLVCSETGLGLAMWVRRQWPRCRILLVTGDVDGVSEQAEKVNDLRAMVATKTELLQSVKELLR